MTEETRISPWFEVWENAWVVAASIIWEIRRGNGRVFGIWKSRILLGHIRIETSTRLPV